LDEGYSSSTNDGYRQEEHEMDDMYDKLNKLEYNNQLLSVRVKHVEDTEDHEIEHTIDDLKDKIKHIHKELHNVDGELHKVDKELHQYGSKMKTVHDEIHHIKKNQEKHLH